MEIITLALLERTGLLLLVAFIVTRIPSFKYLLERELTWKTIIYYSVIFGCFSIAGIVVGIPFQQTEMIRNTFFYSNQEDLALAHSGMVSIVMAGLLGGPLVGIGAGCLGGIFATLTNSVLTPTYGLAFPFIGLFAGLAARFFSKERIISPVKSMFIGMFATILEMSSHLIFAYSPDKAIQFINYAGIPMVISNSIAIAIFTTMIRVVLGKQEQAQAAETERALFIAEKVLPFLKQGLNHQTAIATAQLLKDELKPSAVAVTDTKYILAHIGLGEDHHLPGAYLLTKSSASALSSGKIQVIIEHDEIQCAHQTCPLGAAILVPFHQSGKVAGLIKLYYKRYQQIRTVDIVLAEGLGNLISNQLTTIEAEKMVGLMKEAKLRTLQAQINPHFLFNTLNSIVSLIRTNPPIARHVTLHLAQFMRSNLNILTKPYIPLALEIEHLKAYLEIIDVRFSDQLKLYMQIDPNLEEAYIPPSTIQPLVENCLEHGLKNRSTGGMIWVTIHQQTEGIYISVEDNGKGIAEHLLGTLGKVPLDQEQQTNNGIGVYIVNQRLVALLGEKAELKIKNRSEGGSHISFIVPNGKINSSWEVE